MYLQLLKNIVTPELTDILEHNENELICQQDGAAPHYTFSVCDYLNETFPDW